MMASSEKRMIQIISGEGGRISIMHARMFLIASHT